MRREEVQVIGRGDYVIGTIRHTFFNIRVMEGRMHTGHRMVLAVIRG